VVCVKQGDLDVVSRLKLEDSRGVQGNRFLGRVSAGIEGNKLRWASTHQQVLEVPIPLSACLQKTVGIVDAARISLEAKEHLPCCGRAVDTVLHVREARDTYTFLPRFSAGPYKGERRLSRPARWSLWMWLRKHASGGRSSGCERKKSTSLLVSAMNARH
jgi:hypothetical protein